MALGIYVFRDFWSTPKERDLILMERCLIIEDE